jgi:hypothetical protein
MGEQEEIVLNPRLGIVRVVGQSGAVEKLRRNVS